MIFRLASGFVITVSQPCKQFGEIIARKDDVVEVDLEAERDEAGGPIVVGVERVRVEARTDRLGVADGGGQQQQRGDQFLRTFSSFCCRLRPLMNSNLNFWSNSIGKNGKESSVPFMEKIKEILSLSYANFKKSLTRQKKKIFDMEFIINIILKHFTLSSVGEKWIS